jgi:hypothetical protein
MQLPNPKAFFTTMIALLLLLAVPATTVGQHPEFSRTVEAEAVVQRGADVTRIVVFIVNRGRAAVSFDTGSHGGSGATGDEVTPTGTMVVGTGIVAVPRLKFEHGDGQIVEVTAPRVHNAITRRSMRAAKFEIAPKERKLYYSFLVPSAHVAGKFVGGEITLVDGKVIRIVRLTTHAPMQSQPTKLLHLTLKGYPAGSFIVIPAGVPHFVAAREGTVIVQLSGTSKFRTDYLEK